LQTGHGAPAAPQPASELAFPGTTIGMLLANPTAIVADGAPHRAVTRWAAVMCGTWITVLSSRWLSNNSPHRHFIQTSHDLPGSHSGMGRRCPASQRAYLRAVESRSCRHALKNQPRCGSIGTRARRLQRRFAVPRTSPRVPHVHSPGFEPG
jgi:hypothetical protein